MSLDTFTLSTPKKSFNAICFLLEFKLIASLQSFEVFSVVVLVTKEKYGMYCSCLFVLLFFRRLASNYHQKIDNYKIISDNLSFCNVCI